MNYKLLLYLMILFTGLFYSCQDANDSDTKFSKEPINAYKSSDDSLNLLMYAFDIDFGTRHLNEHAIMYFSFLNNADINGDTIAIYSLDLEGNDSKYFKIEMKENPLIISPQTITNETTNVSQCPYITYTDNTVPGIYTCNVRINNNPHFIIKVKLQMIP
jgi:hypothetical protein